MNKHAIRLIGIPLLTAGLGLACGTGPTGSQGPVGPAGPVGAMGTPGKEGIQGPPGPALTDCPEDYQRDTAAPLNMVLCKKMNDEIVKVGKGRSAFWIDRYEASVWEREDGGGARYGVGDDQYPVPKNGQWGQPGQAVKPLMYALSRAGVVPSRNITWFQAVEACAASGKELIGRQAWFLASQGTPDPGDSDGAGGSCRTGKGATGPRNTGEGSKCESVWGVQDMIGNLWEWTDEWYAAVGDWEKTLPSSWPGADYREDGTWNITSRVYNGTPGPGLPAAALRGGYWQDGSRAGSFALALAHSPGSWDPGLGFRCVIPR